MVLVLLCSIAGAHGLRVPGRVAARRGLFSGALRGAAHGVSSGDHAHAVSGGEAPPQRVVFLGTPPVAAEALARIADAAGASQGLWEVAAVVTQPPTLVGRGKKRALTPSPVARLAADRGIRVFEPEKAKDEGFLEELEALAPDLCITAAYGQFLPRRFLGIPRLGTLNIHPSLLPLWRGASPVQRSLEAGDEITGVSVVWTVLKMDAGPVAAQVQRRLDGSEKGSDLLEELFEVGTQELLALLPNVWTEDCSPGTSKVQDDAAATKADKIQPDEGQVCLAMHSASTIHNRVRGFAAWPGVWTFFTIGDTDEPVKVKLLTTRVCSKEEGLDVGDLSDREILVRKGRMVARCADGSLLEILDLQSPGKKPQDAKVFSNGLRGQRMFWLPAASPAQAA